MIKFHKLNDHTEIPTQGTEGAAGYDLYYSGAEQYNIILRPGQRETIPTGITTEFSSDTVGIIKPRSGLAVRYGIDVLAGVVDPDYRGEIKVCLINHGDKLVVFEPGDRIAQILFFKVFTNAVEAGKNDKLSETNRGQGGFGSTGK